jgi:photosystem II stability/assembly factor-like uncharacterized protein
VDFTLNKDVGYAVGSHQILKTSNGGADWVNLTGIDQLLISLDFSYENIGYVVGRYGAVGYTDDAGNSWQNSSLGNLVDLYSVCNANQYIAYVVGFNNTNNWSTIHKSSYGIWSIQQSPIKYLFSIFFTDENTGYAVGGDFANPSPSIIKTTDGGQNWFIQNSTANALSDVFFINANVGWAAGFNVILKTTNGGGWGAGTDEGSLNSELLKIYPNPAIDKISFKVSEKVTSGNLSISNINGQQLLQQEITESTTTIDVSTLPSGVYVAKVVGEKGVQVGKFLKQ